jgi:hypothetical protein
MGDVLADYVDAGGTVVQTVPTFYGTGWGLQGRFITDGYSPFVGTGDWFLWADLGLYDADHPIMSGVTAAGDSLRQMVDLNAGAAWVADWADDEFIATKGSVVALNTFLPDGYTWTGDIDLIVHNSVIWLLQSYYTDFPWLAADPVSGTVLPDDCATIEVTFDASGMTAGDYQAELEVWSNDPDTPRITLPVDISAFDCCYLPVIVRDYP